MICYGRGVHSHEFVGPDVVFELGTLLFTKPFRRRMSSLPLMRTGWGREALTRNPFHDLPISMFLELVINRRERIVEFLSCFAFRDERRLLEGEHDFGGFVEAKAWQLGPDPAEWGTEPRNDGSRDTTEGESLKFAAAGQSQVKGCRREWRGHSVNVINIQSNLVHGHVGIENDSNVSLETLPDHPPKGDASKTVTFAVLYRSTPNI